MGNQNTKKIIHFLPARWFTVVVLIMIISCFPFTHLTAQEKIRKPAVAGYFYPKDRKELTKTVDDFISNVKHEQIAGKIFGIMSPHAGYDFSGQVAAYAYRHIKDTHYDTVILLGPSHRVYLKGASVGNFDAYTTPLGKVKVNKEIVTSLLDIGEPFHFFEQAHIMEHSVETQIPFLQRVLKQFDIVPIVMGPPSLEYCRKISEALVGIVEKRNVLFVASSDMSHYPDYINANNVDRDTLSLIKKCDPNLVFSSEKKVCNKGIPNLSTTLCGLSSVVTVMMTAKQLGGNAVKILHYKNSGDIAIHGRRETRRVVGYGAVAFYKQ